MLPGLSAGMMMAGGVRPPAFRNLADLFAGGAVDGIMIDLTDTTTLFQDQNGAAAAVSNGDPIGLALDQHKWGGKTLAEYRSAQAEKIANGTFESGIANWAAATNGTLSWNSTDKTMVLTASGAGVPSTVSDVVTTVAGHWYEISVDFVSRTFPTSAGFYVGTTAGGSNLLTSQAMASVGTKYRRFFKATGSSAYVTIAGVGGSGVGTQFDNISIKEIDGHHAVQSSTQRPVFDSISNGALFDGSNDSLRTQDFYFPVGDCALSVYGFSSISNRAFAGAADARYMRIVHGATGNVPYMTVGDTTTINGVSSILGTLNTLTIDKNGTSAEFIVNGVVEATKASPGSTTTGTRDLTIGAQNSAGTVSAYLSGNIKRVVALHARIQDVMSTAEFHENLIAA